MIRFENVAKVYDVKSTPALDDVSLDIERGEFVYLVGSSGSGKSTFMQLVLREHRATDGRVLVAGKDVAKLSSWKVPHLRRQMGAVFQDFRLLPNKTVFENVAFALEVLGRSRSQISRTVPQTLEMVGLAGKERRMPHELSGGEQQRVAIARAFVNRPAILLADEPTGNLDPITSRGIMNVLDRINATGTTIVMATHDVALVDEIRRRVIELDNGRIIRDEEGGTYVTTTSIPVIRVDEEEEELVGATESGTVVSEPEPPAGQESQDAPAPQDVPASQAAPAAQASQAAPATAAGPEQGRSGIPVTLVTPEEAEAVADATDGPAPTSRRELRELRAQQAREAEEREAREREILEREAREREAAEREAAEREAAEREAAERQAAEQEAAEREAAERDAAEREPEADQDVEPHSESVPQRGRRRWFGRR